MPTATASALTLISDDPCLKHRLKLVVAALDSGVSVEEAFKKAGEFNPATVGQFRIIDKDDDHWLWSSGTEKWCLKPRRGDDTWRPGEGASGESYIDIVSKYSPVRVVAL